MPETYVIPDDFTAFYSHFHSIKNSGIGKTLKEYNYWIVKPSAQSRGRGIYIIDDVSQVTNDEQCVVSKYISNPLLINGLKFDLRIYVLITCFDPLRIYIYKEGLTRFASEPYTLGGNSQYSHLTNYSINKKNTKFV